MILWYHVTYPSSGPAETRAKEQAEHSHGFFLSSVYSISLLSPGCLALIDR